MSDRVALFPGTFDPVHVGHLVAAVNARHALALDAVRFVVERSGCAPAGDRLAMVRAAIGGVAGLEATVATMAASGSARFVLVGPSRARSTEPVGLEPVLAAASSTRPDDWVGRRARPRCSTSRAPTSGLEPPTVVPSTSSRRPPFSATCGWPTSTAVDLRPWAVPLGGRTLGARRSNDGSDS